MEKKVFWIYNIIGSVIRAVTIVVLGVFFAEYYEIIVKFLGYILTGIMVLTGLYIWRFKKKEFMKYMQEKNEEIENKLK